MSFTCFNEFEEIFLFGNMKIIDELDCSSVFDYLKDINVSTLENTQWCIFNNLKYILANLDSCIIEDNDTFKDYIHLVVRCFDHFKSKFNIEEIVIDDDNHIGIICYIIVDLIYKKIDMLNSKITDRIKHQLNYNKLIESHDVYVEYNIPYGNWTSKHTFVIDENRIDIHTIDVFLDNLFINTNFKYSGNCVDFIPAIKNRLDIVDKMTYYKKYIFDKIKETTMKIFYLYPLNLIYRDYKLLDYDDVYVPTIYEKLESKNDDAWLFSIINEQCRCYLLGVSVISNGCISEDLQVQKIKKFISDKEGYYSSLSKKNKMYIDVKTDGLTCGNGIDDNGPYDVLFNHVYRFNMDDILIVFSHSTYHLFTCSEFNQLSKNKLNPYNREKINNFLSQITANMEWKNKIIYKLNRRYLKVEFNGTLEDNFNLIKERLMDDKVETNINLVNKTTLNLIMNII